MHTWIAAEMAVQVESQLRDRELERKARAGFFDRKVLDSRPGVHPLAAAIIVRHPSTAAQGDDIARAA